MKKYCEKYQKTIDTDIIFRHITPVLSRDGLCVLDKFFFDL